MIYISAKLILSNHLANNSASNWYAASFGGWEVRDVAQTIVAAHHFDASHASRKSNLKLKYARRYCGLLYAAFGHRVWLSLDLRVRPGFAHLQAERLG
jgi:hypothetical protein